jgi:DNA-directed RNA polymerase subunit K/omega
MSNLSSNSELEDDPDILNVGGAISGEDNDDDDDIINDDDEEEDNDEDDDEEDNDEEDDDDNTESQATKKLVKGDKDDVEDPDSLLAEMEDVEEDLDNGDSQPLNVKETLIRDLSTKVDTRIRSITGSERRTLPILYDYERTALLGHRCNQLMQGAKPVIDQIPEGANSMEIAKLELLHRALPLQVCRKMPDVSEEEVWKLSELDCSMFSS